MTAPHLRFRHLDTAVLTATAALLEAGTATMPHAGAQAEFQQWADVAAAAYHLPAVTVTIDNGDSSQPGTGAHGYSASASFGGPAIHLSGRSVIDLLQSFRRHAHHHGVAPVTGLPDADAAAWALSLYHTVRPRQLAGLVAEGRVLGVTAADFTDSGPASHPAASTDPFERQLHAARDFIGDAARTHRISVSERDRFLSAFDDEARRAPAGLALDMIRARAIDLYDDGTICQEGLSDFLTAAGLDPYDG